MERIMRAKMKVQAVTPAYGESEILKAYPVCSKLDQDGNSEDNTFSKFTPSGSLELVINNPDLRGKIQPGQEFYVDFTLVETEPHH